MADELALPEEYSWMVEGGKADIPGCNLLLGFLCQHGISTPKNLTLAASYYEQAGAKGDIAALFAYASLYGAAAGVSPIKAYRAALLSANAGLADAQSLVGWFCLSGVGVPRDVASAEKWLLKAKANGSQQAIGLLEMGYDESSFGLRSQEKAFDILNERVAQGDATAMTSMANRLGHGEGCTKDERRALELLHMAAELGEHVAALTLSMAYGKGLFGQGIDHNKADYYLKLQQRLFAESNKSK
jgi:uncharacterized protein